ncbi:E2 [Tursiops truncatus papillomavirus 2]|uniref:Regulatory protein E2 n=1 Tax=Tursiops truncatus papillomavirus 2 TaxID=936060 RepID=Q1XA73_9PAPI|nr:E2 [Tursiops truncatus papillomavirus 2]AAY32855.1 E2 [Tursiops truncatus papillomavirus 2]
MEATGAMENLTNHLDVLQETQMEIFEKNSGNISDAVEYWKLMRKEHSLLFLARRNGHVKVGHQMVPPAHVSESSAKDAIGMQLLLEGLQKTEYSTLTWTLSETSKDMYMSPPKETFKKGGTTVTVTYDESGYNCMDYTYWKYVFFQDGDTWTRGQGVCNEKGLAYEKHGQLCYYVTFAEEAVKYGAAKVCDIKWEGKSITNPCCVSRTNIPVTGPLSDNPPDETDEEQQDEPHRCSALPPPTSEQTGSPAKQNSKHLTSHKHRACYKHRGNGRRGYSDSASGRWKQSPYCTEVPALIIRGPPNNVKCYRYRLKQKYPDIFVSCSSTWTWTSSAVREGESNNAHITLTFANTHKREYFLNGIHMPTTMTAHKCTVPSYIIP